MQSRFHRVGFVSFFCLVVASGQCLAAAGVMRVATFSSDITPPLGEPMISGDALRTVEQPLLAKGIVLEADGQRYVLCAMDWCSLCNATHDALRSKLAAAAGTDRAHVAVQTVHQHTAPVVDLDAQKILAERGLPHLHVRPAAIEEIEQRIAAAVKRSLQKLERCDQIGTGQAIVERVASTRRPIDATGKLLPRMSSCKDPVRVALPEGTIDPYLKTITLAHGGKPLVRLHYYATHPQTSYGGGRASSDMVGDAREELQRKEGVFQIYFDGCGGDITMGKYNDGAKERRVELAARLLAGMEASVAATNFAPAGNVEWRTYPLVLPHRSDRGFSEEGLRARIDKMRPSIKESCLPAVRMVYYQRRERPIELTSLQIGGVHIVNLPGEPMICFQLFAQQAQPAGFVAVAGYGDWGPGYICPASAYGEGGYEPSVSSVAPESESLVKKAITSLLGVE